MKTPRHHKLFYGSSYDRGLDMLLYMWPDIIKKYPDAELQICYGWEMFNRVASNNPERMAWKKAVQGAMKQQGIIHHGRVGKEELKKIRQECGILAYPTYFTEINFITGLDCQADGVVPVVCNFKHNGQYTALNETIGCGVKVEGNIRDKETANRFLKELLDLMGDEKRWQEESKKGIGFVKEFTWENISKQWVKEFEAPVSKPLVSIITPTCRKGWWNIMADNISKQTYKNIEWIVVDDYPENRADVMARYCEKYGIENYKYIRGKKSKKYNYALSTANNLGWKAARGSLCVWLQDFVLMPNDGIERLADIHRHNPNAIIAPCDELYASKIKPDIDNEDWFNGKTDIVGKFIRRNQRITGQGMRKTDNYLELELNFGAIPKRILKNLNGFWEFFNDGLGFDDTEIVYRTFALGYELIVDDTILCKCIDHFEPLKDKPEELGKDRTHNLNDPRFVWLINKMKKGEMPVRRDPNLDKKLDYKIPAKYSKSEAVRWMLEHREDIIKGWK